MPLSGAQALESPWRSADYLQLSLSSFQDTTGKGSTLKASLELNLEDGWHSYWRMPGDGGLPPRLDWSKSDNVTDVHMDWPVPERFDTAGLYSFGYEGRVSFPLTVAVDTPGEPAHLELQADIMVCKDICVPQNVNVSLDIPGGAGEDDQPGASNAMHDRLLARLPSHDDTPGLKIQNVILGPDALVASIYSANGFDKADLFVESGDLYITSPPVITPDAKDPHTAMFRIAKPDGVDNLATALQGVTVTLTAVQGAQAVEKSFPF